MQCRREIIFDHFFAEVYIFFKHNIIYLKVMLFVHQNNMLVDTNTIGSVRSAFSFSPTKRSKFLQPRSIPNKETFRSLHDVLDTQSASP